MIRFHFRSQIDYMCLHCTSVTISTSYLPIFPSSRCHSNIPIASYHVPLHHMTWLGDMDYGAPCTFYLVLHTVGTLVPCSDCRLFFLALYSLLSRGLVLVLTRLILCIRLTLFCCFVD